VSESIGKWSKLYNETHRQKKLVFVSYNETALTDGSPPNAIVQKLVSEANRADYRGGFVAYGAGGVSFRDNTGTVTLDLAHPNTGRDLDTTDLGPILAYLRSERPGARNEGAAASGAEIARIPIAFGEDHSNAPEGEGEMIMRYL
jgi:hypothetical protein